MKREWKYENSESDLVVSLVQSVRYVRRHVMEHRVFVVDVSGTFFHQKYCPSSAFCCGLGGLGDDVGGWEFSDYFLRNKKSSAMSVIWIIGAPESILYA